jgi:hypothetical protein
VLLVHAAALVGQDRGLEPAEVEPAVVERAVEPERAVGEVAVEQRAERVEPARVAPEVDDEVPDLPRVQLPGEPAEERLEVELAVADRVGAGDPQDGDVVGGPQLVARRVRAGPTGRPLRRATASSFSACVMPGASTVRTRPARASRTVTRNRRGRSTCSA